MSKLLEEIEPGTHVFVGDERVGEVRGVYCVGESKLAEYLHVFWSSLQDGLLVPTSEVRTIESRGVVLQGPLDAYGDFARFDPDARPDITRLV
ncbi:MAG: hypothetical protein NVS9B12_10370 [Vulcanimicrobiaceae bacterium]